MTLLSGYYMIGWVTKIINNKRVSLDLSFSLNCNNTHTHTHTDRHTRTHAPTLSLGIMTLFCCGTWSLDLSPPLPSATSTLSYEKRSILHLFEDAFTHFIWYSHQVKAGLKRKECVCVCVCVRVRVMTKIPGSELVMFCSFLKATVSVMEVWHNKWNFNTQWYKYIIILLAPIF